MIKLKAGKADKANHEKSPIQAHFSDDAERILNIYSVEELILIDTGDDKKGQIIQLHSFESH